LTGVDRTDVERDREQALRDDVGRREDRADDERTYDDVTPQ